MISFKEEVTEVLNAICDNVTDTYPEEWESFPIICYIEEENKTGMVTDDAEQSAILTYKIDIWNDESTTEMAIKVDEAITSLGFKRTQCIDAPDPNYKHKLMRFTGEVDVNKKLVYRSTRSYY